MIWHCQEHLGRHGVSAHGFPKLHIDQKDKHGQILQRQQQQQQLQKPISNVFRFLSVLPQESKALR